MRTRHKCLCLTTVLSLNAPLYERDPVQIDFGQKSFLKLVGVEQPAEGDVLQARSVKLLHDNAI
jgi:hypothetical protein